MFGNCGCLLDNPCVIIPSQIETFQYELLIQDKTIRIRLLSKRNDF